MLLQTGLCVEKCTSPASNAHISVWSHSGATKRLLVVRSPFFKTWKPILCSQNVDPHGLSCNVTDGLLLKCIEPFYDSVAFILTLKTCLSL
jgi:hypothetical protein